MSRLPRYLNGLLLLVGLSTANLAPAQDDVLAKARELLSQRKGAEAYTLLKPAAEANAGNPDFDLLYGMSAIDAGKPSEATFALERVLDAQPNNAAAQAELGRAYYEMGENDAAKAQFEKVRGEKLPPAVEQNIDRYLTAIDTRTRAARTTYRAYVETGVGYDNNVNSATDDNQVDLFGALNVPFILSSASQEQDSGIWTVNTGFRFDSPLNPQWNLFGGINLGHRATLADTDCQTATGITSCSTSTADGTFGTQYAPTDKDRVRLSAYGQKFYVGGDENRDLAAINTEYVRTLSKSDQVSVFAQFGMFRFPEQSLRDVDRVIGGVGWGHAFGGRAAPLLYASVFGGNEFNQEDNDDPLTPALAIGRSLLGARLGGEVSLVPRARAFASVNYQKSWYDSASPGFFTPGLDPTDCDVVDCREDDYVSVEGGVRYAITRLISVRPEVRYTTNISNVEITDFDRWEALVNFRSDF